MAWSFPLGRAVMVLMRNCSVCAFRVTDNANSEFWNSGDESRTLSSGAA